MPAQASQLGEAAASRLPSVFPRAESSDGAFQLLYISKLPKISYHVCQ